MSAYDVLYENLPIYFKKVKEFIQILSAHGYEIDKLDGNIQDIYNNFFVQTADISTLSYYERLLDIAPSPGDTLSYRRNRIIQQLSLVPQFDINWLITKLNELYGKDEYTLNVNSEECTLDVDITDDVYDSVRLFYDFIWDIIPAHIAIPVKQYTDTDITVGVYAGVIPSTTIMSYINSGTSGINLVLYTGILVEGKIKTVIGGN